MIFVIIIIVGVGVSSFVIVSRQGREMPPPIQKVEESAPESVEKSTPATIEKPQEQTKEPSPPKPSKVKIAPPESRTASPAPPTPPSADLLEGIWQPKIQIIWDSVSGEFREVPFSHENYHSYLEFKRSELCIGGTFDAAGMPAPCQVNIPITIQGDIINLSKGSESSSVRWQIKNGNLELREADSLNKQLFIRPSLPLGPDAPFSSTVKPAQDPQLLQGIWKVDQAFDKGSRGFTESKPLARKLGYQEFKDNSAMCQGWDQNFTKCDNYHPYSIVDGSKIKTSRASPNAYDWYIWKIVNGKLELTAEYWRAVYKKVAALQGPIINYDPASIPKINSITVSHLSVRAGDNITITCKASDNVEVQWIDVYIDGGGRGYAERYNPETGPNKTLTASFTHTLSAQDTYKISCKATDNEELEARSETLSVSSN
ncbi:MAG: hypothetical protein AAB567_02135 [Patescibacteria group bacterium]